MCSAASSYGSSAARGETLGGLERCEDEENRDCNEEQGEGPRDARGALAPAVEVVSLAEFGALPDAVEDGETFAENARIKASFYREKTGCACLADDSGLEVEVLGGKPGIYSARFAGFHADDATNNEKLMEELRKAGVESSAADYRCALASSMRTVRAC